MKLALVADWLVTYGGAEHVLMEFLNILPGTPLFTTVCDPLAIGPLQGANIRTSPLQRLYRITHNHRFLAPFMPRAIESFDLRGFDIVLSSSHAIAKGCLPMNGALHICYCHTPMRYAWLMEGQYLKDFGLRGPLRKLAKRHLMKLRRWDLTASKRVDLFIANSATTKERIERIYGHDSVVLHPPVDDKFFETANCPPGQAVRTGELRPSTSSGRPEVLEGRTAKDYFLAVGRLVPYKRFDLVIEASNRLQLPLKVVGEGSEGRRLKKLAGPTVTFLGRVQDAELPALYADARGVIFPVEEDAGIVPLEAQACGTPVIAYGKGGACDTVIDDKTGILFEEQTTDALVGALRRFDQLSFNPTMIRALARQFSSSRFRSRLQNIVESAYERHCLKLSLYQSQTYAVRHGKLTPLSHT